MDDDTDEEVDDETDDELDDETDDESDDNNEEKLNKDVEAKENNERNSEDIEEGDPELENDISKKRKNINLLRNKKNIREDYTSNTAESGKFVRIAKETQNGKSSKGNEFRIKTKRKDVVSSTENDEYADHDTSDEEDIRNTVGNIPMQWYDEYKHLGYDWDGKPIVKPESGDKIDDFLKRMENPEFWRTVKDPQTGQDVVLGDEDIQLIKRIQAQKIPDVSFDEYAVSAINSLILFIY